MTVKSPYLYMTNYKPKGQTMESSIELNEIKSPLAVAIAAAVKSLEATTKVLKLQKISKKSDKRKLVISTNWLRSFLFFKGTPVVEEVIGDLQGMKIRHATPEDDKFKLVYERSYANRGNETQTDSRNQQKLNRAFGTCESVHITFTEGCLYILPIFAKSEEFVCEPVTLNLQNNVKPGELDTTIFNALDIIEECKARKVYIKSEKSDYLDTKQAMLLTLQLSRMGYSVSSDGTNDAAMVATMNAGSDDDDDTAFINVPLLQSKKGHKEEVLSQVTEENIMNTFFMCSSGVDMYAMEQEGFKAIQLLDRRPIENRDIKKKKCPETGEQIIDHIVDKTEIGAACAAMNSENLRNIFVEDIYTFEYEINKPRIEKFGPVGMVSVSLQCDEFSLAKSNKDKDLSVEDLSTSVDMFIPFLKWLKALKSPLCLIENVPGFANDEVVYGLTKSYLESLGYHVSMRVLNALDYNGYSSRRRMMLCASMLGDDFSFPEKEERHVNLWDDYLVDNLHRFRDVSHTQIAKLIREGEQVQKRVRAGLVSVDELSKKEQTQLRKYSSSNWIEPGAGHCGTILKSQSRQVSESLTLNMDGKALFPDNEVIRFVMGIDSGFKLDKSITKEDASEIIGQSVDIKMHKRFCNKVKEHIARYFSGAKDTVLAETVAMPLPRVVKSAPKPIEEQVDVEMGYQFQLFA